MDLTAETPAADALEAEADWLRTAHVNSHPDRYSEEYRRGFLAAAGWVQAHAEQVRSYGRRP